VDVDVDIERNETVAGPPVVRSVFADLVEGFLENIAAKVSS